MSEKIKLSTLPLDAKVIRERCDLVYSVEEILEDLENYRKEEIYTTYEVSASLDAESVLDTAIEQECDNMYEDWDESIKGDIESEDTIEMQAILDRILARNPSGNIAYCQDKLIEIDIPKEGEQNG